MDIVFSCPKCRQNLTVDEAGAGMSIPCPACGKEITIPALSNWECAIKEAIVSFHEYVAPAKPVWLRAVNDVLRENVQRILEGRNNPGDARLAIGSVLRETGYQPEPGDENTAADFLQIERLNLVIETNVNMARSYAQAVSALDPDIIDFYPAWRLTRWGSRKMERNWAERWTKAAADTPEDGRNDDEFIALKIHLIWERLGSSELFDDALDTDYPPFAFDSGMGVEEVNRTDAEGVRVIEHGEHVTPRRGVRPPRFIPIEDARMTEWLQNQPEECGHCGEAKPRMMLTDCETCEETICPDCKAKGCTGPFEPEPPEPRNAFDCYNQLFTEMGGEPFPLRKEVAERVLSLCNRAFEFGFAEKYRNAISRTHRMRGEALESLGQKEEALREYELAMEQYPNVGTKKRLESLRKNLAKT